MAYKRKDIICKSTLEDHTADMLRFFYPRAEQIFDLSKGFEWLNIELADLNPDRENIKDSKLADRVLKVYTIPGDIAFIIIAVEFQGYHDPDFHKRLFTYFYRLFDKYGSCVTLLPIYTESVADGIDSSFDISLFDTDLHFSVKPYKIWEQNEASLALSNNPYAFVILIIMLGEKGKQEERLSKGIALANTICSKPFSNIDKVNLLKFMRLYFDFENIDLRAKFDAAINTLTNKPATMGIIELDKMWAVEEALEQGSRNGRIKDAIKMLQLGADYEFIHKVTDLPLKEIKELAS